LGGFCFPLVGPRLKDFVGRPYCFAPRLVVFRGVQPQIIPSFFSPGQGLSLTWTALFVLFPLALAQRRDGTCGVFFFFLMCLFSLRRKCPGSWFPIQEGFMFFAELFTINFFPSIDFPLTLF